MHRKPASERRGTTLPEVLVVVVLTAVILTMVATLSTPMFAASNSEEAKVDTIRSLGQAKYRIQRDIRQSDVNGIFVCTQTNGSFTCTPASNYTTPTDSPYLAILSLHAGGNGTINWDPTGRPAWTGFEVYWLAPNASGVKQLLHAFSAANIPPGTAPTILNADVVNAVSAAANASSPESVALGVSDMQTAVEVARDRVAFRLFAQSTEGQSTNETSLQADVFARN